ncbi:hypothetical protein [Oceanobacillus sp. CF4.6]|uniref:hypothetical protein n=1 Tax=Oceanobacillus sp. CF4.6 TaxID=3373080 RepID=UPI003EE521E3
MKQLFLIVLSLLLITGCNQQSNIDMVEVLGKTENTLRESEEIETTASSFDGEKDVKFRLMVEENPTNEEATILFNEIIENIASYSNHSDVWDYYNGYFDIKSYDNRVLYEATKFKGEGLDVTSK